MAPAEPVARSHRDHAAEAPNAVSRRLCARLHHPATFRRLQSLLRAEQSFAVTTGEAFPMPLYKHASYAGETIQLQNPGIRLDFHKRLTGWGWGEIFNAQGEFIAVLDH